MSLQNQSPLDDLHAAARCRAKWEQMDAVEGSCAVRFCRTCEKNVYNVSGMERRAAEVNLRRYEGENCCVRFSRRADGTLITNDCPVGRSAWRQTERVAIVLLAFTVVLLSSPLSLCLRRGTAFTCRSVPALKSLGETERGQKIMMWLDAPQPPQYQCAGCQLNDG